MHANAAHRIPVLAQPTGHKIGHLKAYDQGVIHVRGCFKKETHFEYPAVVLAVLGNLALIEYECANGTTSLAFVRNPPRLPGPLGWVWERVPIRPCSYQQLLKPWLIAIINQKGAWRGIGRRGELMPTPAEVLTDRFVMNRSPRSPSKQRKGA